MKNVSAGGRVSQASDAKSSEQDMKRINTPGEVVQEIGTTKEKNSLSLSGFGEAKGKWAVIVIGVLFVAFLLWRYLGAH